MSPEDRDSLILLLNTTKNVYQNISHGIHWSAADAEGLDRLRHSSALSADIYHRMLKKVVARTPPSSETATEISVLVPMFLAYKAWQRTKAVYSFSAELVHDMTFTEDTSIYISLLDHLPFKDMLFFIPEGSLPTTDNTDTAGIYVHIERYPEQFWILFNYVDRMHSDGVSMVPGSSFAFPIADGMKVSDVYTTPEYLNWLESYKKELSHYKLSESEYLNRLLAEKIVLNTAINLMYYLSSKNADVKEIKSHKKSKKGSAKPEKNASPAVRNFEVGNQYAEIVYRSLKEESASDDVTAQSEGITFRDIKSGVKKRPHARKAHWHHYWTGTGRTTLEVRWISDLFVGANRDNQAVIVYDIKKKSLKGQKNPNRSKKK